MNFVIILLVFTVGMICFALRALVRIGKPLVGHDAWAILLVVDQLKRGGGYNGVTKYFLISGEHDYPPLFFYFLSLFPSSWLRRCNWVISPILDSLNAAFLILLSYFLTSDAVLSAIAGLIYSFTPVVLEESLTLSTRSFGTILFNSTLVSFALYQFSGNITFFMLTVAGGILVLLSHKYATQVLYLLLVSFAVINHSLAPLMTLLMIVLGAVLLSAGFYLKVLRGHVGIIRFWFRHHTYYERLQEGENYLSRLGVENPELKFPTHRIEDAGSAVRRFWRKTKRANPLYWLLSLNPFNPFALVAVLVPFVGIRMTWEWIFAGWSVLTLVFYYLAACIRVLGQHQARSQFLDYNAFPTALLCAIFVWESFSYWKVLIVSVVFFLSLVQVTRAWTRLRRYSRNEDDSLLKDIYDYLRKSPRDGVICLPASHTYAIPYFTGKKVFYTVSARNYMKIGAFFPMLAVPLRNLIEEYGISFVILDKRVVAINAIDLSGLEQVMERNDYVLLEKTA